MVSKLRQTSPIKFHLPLYFQLALQNYYCPPSLKFDLHFSYWQTTVLSPAMIYSSADMWTFQACRCLYGGGKLVPTNWLAMSKVEKKDEKRWAHTVKTLSCTQALSWVLSFYFISWCLCIMLSTIGPQGWRSGKSACLPPMWSSFNSRTRQHAGWICC